MKSGVFHLKLNPKMTDNLFDLNFLVNLNNSFSHSNQFNCSWAVRKEVACTQESSDRILKTYYAQEIQDLMEQVSED